MAIFKLKFASCLLVMTAFSLGAQAAPTWYMKGKLGTASADAELDVDPAAWGYDEISDEATSWSLGAGVELSDYVGLELAYTDYNEFGDSYSAGPISGTASGELNAVAFSVVGTLPLSDAFSLYGSVGLASWEMDFRDEFQDVLGAGSIRASDDGSDVVFGIGALVHLSDFVALGIDYERFDVDASPADLDIDVGLDTLSASVVLRL